MAPGRQELLLLAAVLAAACGAACGGPAPGGPGTAAGAFLPSLPLAPVLAVPASLLEKATTNITVSERSAIQVVFSRPVIALGSDFAVEKLPESAVPFAVDCALEGRGRWVTTSTYRWDPVLDWPPDLDCSFSWNLKFKSFDGVPLTLASPRTVKLVSRPLRIEVATITSAGADNATDSQWNAYKGMDDDNFPEVPPDANITLLFSYPVSLSMLASALQVVSCCGSDAGSKQKVTVLPCPWESPYVAASPFDSPAQRAAALANATCAVVQIRPGLPAKAGAILRLPKGARYSSVAGRLSNDSDTYIWGLRRFRIPLRSNFQQLASAKDTLIGTSNAISFRRLTLWLPHGLAAGVTVERLKQQISLCRYSNPYNWASTCYPVDVSLSLENRGQLLMTVPTLAPRQHYRLGVQADASIKDGYGQPLEASRAYFFTTEPSSAMQGPQLASGAQVMLLEPAPSDKPLPWPLAWRGNASFDAEPRAFSDWAISGTASLVNALQVLAGDRSPTAVAKLLSKPTTTFKRPLSQETQFKDLSLSGIPGLQLTGFESKDGVANALMVAQSDLQYAGMGIGSRVHHFVTLTQSAATPVAGAKVYVFLAPYAKAPTAGPVCTTGADGTCSVDLAALMSDGTYGNLAAVVEAKGHGPLLVLNMPTPPSWTDEALKLKYVGHLVLDRALVNPGDSLHVTGYIQQRAGPSRLELASAPPTLNVSIAPGFLPSNGMDGVPVSFPATVNASHGSFHLTIPVPAGAKPGSYSITLSMPRSVAADDGAKAPSKQGYAGTQSEWAQLASDTFTIGTPRPPTAKLNVTAPDWVPPTGTARVRYQASSYLGADVGGAVIQVSWFLPRASGAFNLTTDAAGLAETTIPLGSLPTQNATRLGDVLSLSSKWVGPTREVIIESTSVRIANGPVKTEVTRSPQTDAPGVPFMVAASTWANNRDLPAIEGVTVEVHLEPNSSRAMENCTAGQVAALKAQTCTVTSGVAPAAKPCMLTLPCAADLKLVACALRFRNGTAIKGGGGQGACSETPIGRNTSAWADSPWAFLPKLVLLKDRENYTVGSSVTLSWVNAYWRPAVGMLIWGSPAEQKRKLLPSVAPGANSVSLKMGSECLGGCVAQLVLALPRPGSGDAVAKAKAAVGPLGLGLPASRLFDPLSPATAAASVDLKVLDDDNRLNVSITVGAAAGPSGAAALGLPAGLFRTTAEGPDGTAIPIMPPGSSADITVQVTDAVTGKPAPDAEVTLVAVDEAVLALLPYPLQDLAAEIVRYPSLTSFLKEINDYRVARRDINTTFDVLRRRLALDPWLPLVTTVQPSSSSSSARWGYSTYYPVSSPVDVPDALYLRGFTDSPTERPFYSWGLSQRYPAGSKGPADPGAALRLSGDFETTPLFTVVTTRADGAARATFKAPSNLGTFTVRAYAVSKGVAGKASKFGSNETAVIVRQPLSLTGSVPKSVRVTDDFEAGVLVSAPDSAGELVVEVTATVVPAQALKRVAAKPAAPAAPTAPTAAAAKPRAVAAGPGAQVPPLRPGPVPPPGPRGRPGRNLLAAGGPLPKAAAGAKPAKPAKPDAPAPAPAAAGGAPAAAKGAAGSAPPAALALLPSGSSVTQLVTLSPQQQQAEVRFQFTANALGTAGVKFEARVRSAGGGATGTPAARAGRALLGLLGRLHLGRRLAGADAEAGPVADALQEDITVEGQQGAVFVATSFALPAKGPAKARTEALVLPQAAPGSGSVQLLSGVGFLPAIKTTYASLIAQQQAQATAQSSDSFVPSGPDALNAAVLPALLARYEAATVPTKGAPSAALMTAEQLGVSAAAAAAAAQQLTTPELGLMFYQPASSAFLPRTPAVGLNAWAAWLLDAAEADKAPGGGRASRGTFFDAAYTAQPGGGARLAADLRNASAAWKEAAAKQLVANAEEAHAPLAADQLWFYQRDKQPARRYMDFDELSWARLALGPGWVPPAGTNKSAADDLTLSRQVAAATTPSNTSVSCQARTGLVLQQLLKAPAAAEAAASASGVTKAAAKAAADKLAKLLLSSLRITGRSAYLTAGPDVPCAASSEDQALALLFLQQADVPAAREVLPKLASTVAGGRAGLTADAAAASVCVGGTAPGTVAVALAAYDAQQGSTAPDVTLKVSAIAGAGANASLASAGAPAGPAPARVLMDAAFTPATAGGLVNSTTPFDALPPRPELRFEAGGTSGEVMAAAGLDFVPAALLPFPSYRGLWVSRVIGTEAGVSNLAAAPLADIVTVTVQITSPEPVDGVVLEVLLPGGLEPIDPLVYADPDLATQCGSGGSDGDNAAPAWWTSWWCPAQTTSRSRVRFQWSWLGAGSVSVRFKCVAATPGRWVLPPVRAFALKQPEVMGLSAAGEFTVCPERRAAAAAASAKASSAGVVRPKDAGTFAGCGAGAASQRAPLAPPKPCPDACNGNGVCDLSSGTCRCERGFGGAACAVAVAV